MKNIAHFLIRIKKKNTFSLSFDFTGIISLLFQCPITSMNMKIQERRLSGRQVIYSHQRKLLLAWISEP